MGRCYRRIKDMREDHDYTQAQTAAYLGTSTTQYGRWERGERDIPVEALMKLAKRYNLSMDYLTGLIDTPAPLEREGAD